MSEKKVLQFGTAKAGPGQRGNGYIKVGELCDGSPIDMPVIILNGKNPGPRLLIWGLEDGDEYPGPLGALDAVNSILPKMLNEMRGSVVFLPATNISAFRGNPFGGGQRNSPLDIDQGLRLPNLYPGNPYGRHTEQLAHQITQLMKEYDPDVLIRLHGCKQIYGWDRVLVKECPPGSPLDKLARACVTKSGGMVILTFEEKGKPEGRPLEISMETNGGDDGVGNGFNGGAIRDGILNVMRHMKMIPGKEIEVDKIQYVRYKRGVGPGGFISSSGIYSTRGGFFRALVKIKDYAKEGQVIGEIRNFFGELLEEIKSPINGIVIGYYCEAPHIGSGQWRLFEIAEPIEYR